MEISEQFQGGSICGQLNLRIEDLNVQDLLSNPIYRRLYNIVVNDANKSEYQYRKNLIRQLYFLLKITPIMKIEVQQLYLQRVQRWYNKNDHKKTELGSGRLRNLVDEYVTTKQNSGSQNELHTEKRPQSGVAWNNNVIPFLRPYTSKRPTNYQSRPESYKSKFGESTIASTRIQKSCEIEIRDFGLSIKQQLEISEDFINKNRTIHPQSEPIYEQLFSIMSGAGIRSRLIRNEQEDGQNQILFQRDKQQFLNSPGKDITRIDPLEDNVQEDQIIGNDLDEFDKVSEESEKQEENKDQERKLEKKIFTQDLKQSSDNKNSIEGFLYLKNENQNDTLLLKKLNNKYSHITNNKFVTSSKDDHQIIRNYLNYSRVKSAFKKQLNRKTQSQRLLTPKSRSSNHLSTTQQKNTRIYTALPRKKENLIINNSNQSNLNLNTAQYFDFSRFQLNKSKENTFATSHYNQRQELDKVYKRPIDQYKKTNKNNIPKSEIKSKDKNLLTKYDCFLERQRVNPIANVHIERHNQQALEEIEKIKEKVAGLTKTSLSTECLMKALYIDSYDDIGSCQQVENFMIVDSSNSKSDQKVNDAFNWKKRDVCYNLLSNGQKKMKKKTRKQVKK